MAVRIYSLAKELKVDSKELVDLCTQIGIGGKGSALASLSDTLAALPADADGEAIQNAALNVARKIERYQDHAKQSPEGGPGVSVAFFQMIYQVLIGQERGPRFGSFAALYGVAETRALIAKGLAGELAA